MGGKGKGEKGKGKGKGQGGKGKGKGKGKGRGKESNLDRNKNELATVLGNVLGTDTSGWKKSSSTWAQPSRKTARKEQRKQLKERRTYYFTEGRRRGGAASEPASQAKAKKKSKDAADASAGAEAASSFGGWKSRRRRDDDDEITSEEDDAPKRKRRVLKASDAQKAGDDGGDDDISSEEEGQDDGDDDDDDDQGDEEEEGEEEEEEDEEEADEVGEDGKAAKGSDAPATTAASTAGLGGLAGASKSSSSYVPPHLRGKASASAAAAASNSNVAPLRKQLRGIMNRVTEGNLDPTARDLRDTLEKLIPEVGSAVAAEDLLKVQLPAAVQDPNISVLLVGCHVALVVSMHLVFGQAFGVTALVEADRRLRTSLESAEASSDANGEDARVAKNCVSFLALMFSFGLLQGRAICDMVKAIFRDGNVSEIRIDLALTTLRYAGRALRSECAEDFRELLAFVTATAGGNAASAPGSNGNTKGQPAAPKAGSDGSAGDMRTRVGYLLRELQDLKNNKVSFTAMDRFEPLRNWLKTTPMLRGKKVSDAQIALQFDFMTGQEVPAHLLTGASNAGASKTSGKALSTAKDAKGAEPLRALALQQRLNTELRQSLFVAIMGAEDFEHAAERLIEVSATAKAGIAEACLIVFHCAIREKSPNPYYEHVATSMCSRPPPMGNRFVHNFKRAAVQHLQQAHTYGLRATVALAELIAALVVSTEVELPLAIIRFVKFSGDGSGLGGSLGSTLGLLVRHMVESLLRRASDPEAAASHFESLAKYEDVRQGILLVLDSLVKPRLPPKQKDAELWDKFRSVRKKLVTMTKADD